MTERKPEVPTNGSHTPGPGETRRVYAAPRVTLLGDFRSITRMPTKGHSSSDGTASLTKNPA